jgi:hypothetical protein
MKKIVVLIVLSFIFYSCKDKAAFQDSFTFYFENPQPINDSELTSIPNKFIGEYINSDSVVLKINKNAITSENLFQFKFPKNQLDSLKTEFNFANGKYISKTNNTVFDYKMVGDSIEFSSREIDTIFIFSESQKAKRINGFLILNEKKSKYWEVTFVNLNKNNLEFKHLYAKNDLRRMDSITKIHSKTIDSTTFIITPTRREFSKFLQLKDFGYQQVFTKTSN